MATDTLQNAPVPATVAPLKWHRRVGTHNRSIERQEIYYSRHMDPANRAHDAARDWGARSRALGLVRKIEEEFDRHVDRSHKALRLVMLTPAPDLAALAHKLDLAVADSIEDYGREAAEFIAAMRADARRLVEQETGK